MNRLEYCSIAFYDTETYAARVPHTDQPLYVRTKYVDMDKVDDPLLAYIAWDSWADDSSKAVVLTKADKDPELKYQEYVRHDAVDSADVTHDDCWAEQYANRKDEPVEMGGHTPISSYDKIEGSAIKKSDGTKILLNSRGDRWYTIEEVDAMTGSNNTGIRYDSAKRMYGYDPSPERLACYNRAG